MVDGFRFVLYTGIGPDLVGKETIASGTINTWPRWPTCESCRLDVMHCFAPRILFVPHFVLDRLVDWAVL